MNAPRRCFNAESTAKEIRTLTATIERARNAPAFRRIEEVQCANEIVAAVLLHLHGRLCELESRLEVRG